MKKNSDLDISEMLIGGVDLQSDGVTKVVNPSFDIYIYIDDEITEPSNYRKEFEALINATQNDSVTIVINSPGGSCDTGIQLVSAIKQCNAHVTAYIPSMCASMATGIALACDNWIIGEHTAFMCHTASWGSLGKDMEVHSHAGFMKGWVKKFITSTYEGFLTKAEITRMAKGEDLYFDSDALKDRLAKYAAFRKQKNENPVSE